MAANPPGTTNTGVSVQPVFKRVQQQSDHDCAFACIATITGKSLIEVIQVAVDKFEHPIHGPYWITEELIAKIFAHYSFVSTVYKEITKGIVDVPDVAIVMVDYDPETELGRHAVFVRDQSNQKQITAYVIDPAYWIDSSLHIRNDFKVLQPAYWIGVHPMKQTAKAGK
jgi:hypothetical protein